MQPAGQRYLQLALWQPEKPESPTESSTMPAEKPPAPSQGGSSGSTVGGSDRKVLPPPPSAMSAAGKPAPQKGLHRVSAPFEVVDASGAPIIRVTDTADGFTRGIYVFDRSGILQLFDLGGTTMVEAGTSSTGVGVVRTGPMSRGTAAWLGTPGSFIIGKR